MTKKLRIVCSALIVLFMLLLLAHILGVGYKHYESGSAKLDLKKELTEIYGEEYSGKVTKNGTQDMRFEITPRSFFITRSRFRAFFNLDYIYTCKVIYTDHVDGYEPKVRTITYRGVDEPLNYVRAYLLPDTKTEK